MDTIWQTRRGAAPGRWLLQARWFPGAPAADDDATRITLRLAAADGTPLAEEHCTLADGCGTLEVAGVTPWSPEAPVLYQASLQGQDGLGTRTQTKGIGFGAIQRDDGRVLWNGSPLRLRGICYNEKPGAAQARLAQTLQRFKAAHINYIRGLYRPFSEEFLALCDELGFFVEDAAPLHDIGGEAPATQDSPADLEGLYLAPLRRMVLGAGSHVSVLLWSLGQDCVWGSNFSACRRWLKSVDDQRLVTFHLPMTVPQTEPPLDAWPVHYRDARLPADEHYDQMVIFHSPGAHNPIGYATGQAAGLAMPVIQDIYAPVPCHNLDELARDAAVREFWGESLKRHWAAIEQAPNCLGGAILAGVDEAPDSASAIAAERDGWQWGILDAKLDPKPEYHHVKMVYAPHPPFTKTESGEGITITNGRLCYQFSARTCQLTGATVEGTPALCGGPFLQATRLNLEPWQGTGLEAEVMGETARVLLRGAYGNSCTVEFGMTLHADGKIELDCRILSMNAVMPYNVKAGIGLDPGGLDERGVALLAPPGMNQLRWERDGLWDWYPAEHLAPNAGSACAGDTEKFYAAKHRLRRALLADPQSGAILLALGDGKGSLRLENSPDPRMLPDDRSPAIAYTGRWYEVNENFGCLNATESMSDRAGDTALIRFSGTGIAVYGSTDMLGGLCTLSLDGRPLPGVFSQALRSEELAIMGRGFEKRFRVLLWRISGLADGPHSLTVRVEGRHKAPSSGNYISIDYCEVESPACPPATRVIWNEAYNYTRLVQGNFMAEPVMLHAGDTVSGRFMLDKGMVGI